MCAWDRDDYKLARGMGSGWERSIGLPPPLLNPSPDAESEKRGKLLLLLLLLVGQVPISAFWPRLGCCRRPCIWGVCAHNVSILEGEIWRWSHWGGAPPAGCALMHASALL